MLDSKGSRATRWALISARMSRSESSTRAPYRVPRRPLGRSAPGSRAGRRPGRMVTCRAAPVLVSTGPSRWDTEVHPAYVAVVGPSAPDDPGVLDAARTAGALLAERGYVVVTGGLGGVMAAAAAGASDAGGTAGGPLPGPGKAAGPPPRTGGIPTGHGGTGQGPP